VVVDNVDFYSILFLKQLLVQLFTLYFQWEQILQTFLMQCARDVLQTPMLIA